MLRSIIQIKIGTASALLLGVMVLMQVPAAQAFPFPTSYDIYNGNAGYLDDTYSPDPSNNHLTAGAYLSGGLGDLTDGITGPLHSDTNPGLFVGWQNYDPTITFHFAGVVDIGAIAFFVDGNSTGGGVNVPSKVAFTMGPTTVSFDLWDGPGGGVRLL